MDKALAVQQLHATGSQCEPFRELILGKCELGLSAKRIHQDLVADHGFDGKYWSVNRFVKALGASGNRQEPLMSSDRSITDSCRDDGLLSQHL
jgi:hypothetical protein